MKNITVKDFSKNICCAKLKKSLTEIPQIEEFASKNNVALEKGWKVEVAKCVMQ